MVDEKDNNPIISLEQFREDIKNQPSFGDIEKMIDKSSGNKPHPLASAHQPSKIIKDDPRALEKAMGDITIRGSYRIRVKICHKDKIII